MAKDKPKKPRRPRAETPKGFRDYFGAEVRARAAMLDRITEVYHAWGFEPLETSAVETVEALGKFLPDVDRPNEGVFAWQDEDEAWLALRYDLTAPLARVFAQHRTSLPTPYRRYQVGPVWRNEKPGPGRFRQFYQCDADTVGAASRRGGRRDLHDARRGAGGGGDRARRLRDPDQQSQGAERRPWRSPASSTRPIPEAARRPAAASSCAAIDKLDRLGGRRGVRALLGAGPPRRERRLHRGRRARRRSRSAVILDFIAARADDAAATCARLRELVGGSAIGREGVAELETIAELLDARGAPGVIDPSVVRGLGYYTGPVFEAELTFETLGDDGRPRQFGSVAGGGRYDDLVKRFTGEAVPATGVSIGVDRLLAALGEKGRLTAREPGPVVVTVMDRDRMAGYQAMAAELRAAGLRAEVFLGGGNLARQLKYADQRGSPVAVIEGGDERARGVVQLKDLALGARLAAEITSREDWTAQPAQAEVPRGELVAAVRAMLARGA